MYGRVTYSERNIPVLVIQVTITSAWQRIWTTKRNELARVDFSEFVIVHRGRFGIEVEGCVIARSLEPFPGQAVDEMLES